MRRLVIASCFLAAIFVFLDTPVRAQDISPSEQLRNLKTDRTVISDEAAAKQPESAFKFEFSLAFDQLFPANKNGSWEQASLVFYHTPAMWIEYFIEADYGNFNGESVGTFSAGATMELGKHASTYLSVATGTVGKSSNAFSGELWFGFPFGAGPVTITPEAGLIYTKYWGINTDITTYPGLMLEWREWWAEYYLYVTVSEPGDVTALSNRVAFGYTKPARFWSYITAKFGNQGYMSKNSKTKGYVLDTNRFWDIWYTHRHWIRSWWGLFGYIDYCHQEGKNNFDKVGFQIGAFWSF
ncbi:MAG: YaiO family outer membrane beta-barrel protein [Myxococcota bacterium]